MPTRQKPEGRPGALDRDTIAAIATAPGQGGVGVIRVSGPEAFQVSLPLLGSLPPPRQAALRSFRDSAGAVLDQGIVLCFPGPRSFTGEDVVELQGHGGTLLLSLLLEALLASGARLARPGEFSERAFQNGKLDLTQAEAVADLIASGSEAAVRAASRSLAGEFSARVLDIDREVLALRTYVEASIDFSDEDIDLLAAADIHERLRGVQDAIAALRSASAQGVMLRDGISLALLGAPNAGKSSLLNRLAGEERAIVTEVAGTTRDLVRVPLSIDGLPVELVDTAGVRETADPIELEGVRRARQSAEQADLVLLVEDLSVAAEPLQTPPGVPSLRVLNKVDLTPHPAGAVADDADAVRVSAVSGAGIGALKAAIKARVGFAPAETTFSARQRHLDALDRASLSLEHAVAQNAIELMAEELRAVHLALADIVGETTPDDLLGEIFSSFCIGK